MRIRFYKNGVAVTGYSHVDEIKVDASFCPNDPNKPFYIFVKGEFAAYNSIELEDIGHDELKALRDVIDRKLAEKAGPPTTKIS